MKNLNKGISLFLALVMVLSLMSVSAFAYNDGTVAVIGETEYTTLETAFTAAAEVATEANPVTVQIVKSGTYSLPGKIANVVIDATTDGVEATISSDASYGQNIAKLNNVTFKNITFKFSSNLYTGFQHSETVTLENCTLIGMFNSYGSMQFTGCTFYAPGTTEAGGSADYSMWVYGAGTVNYNNCHFYGAGKFLNLYKEGSEAHTVNVTGCDFHSTKSNKAALNVKATCNSTPLNYTVTISNSTTDSNFPAASSSASLVVIDPLVQVDDIKAGVDSQITVTLGDEQVYPVPIMAATVGEGADYAELKDAIAAVSEGATITLTSDVTVADAALNIGKNMTIDLDHHTLTFAKADNHVGGGSAVTIKNGSIVFNTSTAGDCIIGSGGYSSNGNSITFDSVSITSSGSATGYASFYAYDGGNVINFIGCTISFENDTGSAGGAFKGSDGSGTFNFTDSCNVTIKGHQATSVIVNATLNISSSTFLIENNAAGNGINNCALTVSDSNITIQNNGGRGLTVRSGAACDFSGNSVVVITGNTEAGLSFSKGVGPVKIADTVAFTADNVSGNNYNAETSIVDGDDNAIALTDGALNHPAAVVEPEPQPQPAPTPVTYDDDDDDDDYVPYTPPVRQTEPEPVVEIEEETVPLAALPESLAEVTLTVTNEAGEEVEVSVAELPNVYADVADDSWARDAIAYANTLGLMNGVGEDDNGDKSFNPEGTTTSEMLTTVLFRAVSGETTEGENWAESALAWASDTNLTEGLGLEEGKEVTREQMVTMMYRVAAAKGFDVTAAAELEGYTDAEGLSDFALAAMQWAVSIGLIKGTSDTTLDPSASVTRAQIATILMRFNEMTKTTA